MSVAPKPDCNVRQVVPFLRVSDMARSVRFYIDGLGCTMKQKWVVDEKMRWCWLELGGAALMLQTYTKEGPPCVEPWWETRRRGFALLSMRRRCHTLP